MGENEKLLVEKIQDLINSFPTLRVELSSILWRLIWMPKIAELSNREELDKRRGIYKLTLKADERICYIGQTTTSFKDR